MVTVSGNPNPTNPTYPTNPTNPTNPTTKYRCEFGTLFCIYAPVAVWQWYTTETSATNLSQMRMDECTARRQIENRTHRSDRQMTVFYFVAMLFVLGQFWTRNKLKNWKLGDFGLLFARGWRHDLEKYGSLEAHPGQLCYFTECYSTYSSIIPHNILYITSN